MKLSYSWLKELTGCKLSPEKLAEILNLQVAAVEGIKKIGEGLDKVVVAEILEIKKHPQADRLQLVKVATKQFGDKKTQQFDIVCGAFNIKIGDKVPLALPGAKLANGTVIKESVIRGEKSQGMLCAEDELGIGDDHTGILILDKLAKVGEEVSKILGLDETIIEIENSALTHRPDLFGHIGFAKEISAITNSKLKIQNSELKLKTKNLINLKIKVEDYKNCPRYMAVVMDNIKIAPSPIWLQNRLRNLGIRPINNVVDITNYVLLEIGQPLHAFDFDRLANGHKSSANIRGIGDRIHGDSRKIIIRRAKTGEKLFCLDGVERELDSNILVIADAQKPIALAGIMGGEHSGITENTKTVVIESANFNPVVIRKGARQLGLRTEANLRFEKGLPLIFTEQGMVRAIELIQKIANGRIISEIYDVKSKEVEKKLKTKKIINVEIEKISDLIGEKISEAQIKKYLTNLGFITKKTGKSIRLVVPTHRNDIEYPEDVIEEVARIYGYQKIKPEPIKANLEVVASDPLLKLEKNLKNILIGLGFDEIYNYSFYGEKTINFLKLKKNEHLEIANPLNPDQQYLRTSLLPKLLEKAAANNPFFDSFRIFEIGQIYKLLLEQNKYLGGLILEKNKKMLYLIKGVIETILEKIGVHKEQISYQLSQNQNYQYLDNFTGVMIEGEAIGLFGLVKHHVKDNLKITADLGVFEINLEKLVKIESGEKKFEKISAYPPIRRDLALIIPKNIIFNDLYQTIKKFNTLIYAVEPFDVFESEKLGPGVRNVAFHLTFQSFERTLVSQEVDKIITDLVRTLGQKFQAKLRNF